MNWANSEAFWAMGGYGFYVWGSYGAVLAALALEVLQARRTTRRTGQILANELSDNQTP